MKLSKIYLGLLFVSVIIFLYSCDSVTDSAPLQDEIQSQGLTVDSDAKTKVDVCHLDDEDNYKLISIAEPALKGHEKHGDGLPGEAVPDMEGYIFDETCTPELDDRMTACFKEAVEGVLTMIPIDELNLESFSGWEDYEPANTYPNWYGIQTPLNGGYLKVWVYEESSFVHCLITYPFDVGDYIQNNTAGGFSDSFEEERNYLEYLYNDNEILAN